MVELQPPTTTQSHPYTSNSATTDTFVPSHPPYPGGISYTNSQDASYHASPAAPPLTYYFHQYPPPGGPGPNQHPIYYQHNPPQYTWSSPPPLLSYSHSRQTVVPPPPFITKTATNPSSSSSSSSGSNHKVYLLNCAHCQTFLSDRGMKAVLLLKPNITLFSTDAVPANCGALYPPTLGGTRGDDVFGDDEVFNDSLNDLEMEWHYEDEERASAFEREMEVRRQNAAGKAMHLERTCDCLTQSLGCLGCGSLVGYHIIKPCDRCTSSVTKHSRSANGHRFVFHHAEVIFTERFYIPFESGVNPVLPRPKQQHHIPLQQSHSQTSIPIKGAVPGTDAKETVLKAAPVEYKKRLNLGDTVYWSNLVKGGEQTTPNDYEYALRKRAPAGLVGR